MKTKLFETNEGVELFLVDNWTYECSNIKAVRKALFEDINNYRVDPIAAELAHHIVIILEEIDLRNSIFPKEQ